MAMMNDDDEVVVVAVALILTCMSLTKVQPSQELD